MNTPNRGLGAAWIVALVGAWMVISPFALHVSSNSTATIINIALGIALILFTLVSAKNVLWRGMLIILAGGMYTAAFMVVTPHGAYLWNNLLLGVVVIMATVVSSSPYPDNYVPEQK